MKTNNIIVEKTRSGYYYKINQIDSESDNYILLFKQELIDLPEIIKNFIEKEKLGQ